MPVTEEFCPECGAALEHDGASDGSDTAVYPELARANLLRMRGDYKAAEQQCLTILRRYPNNTTANILLGDICAEKGDLEQAIQWYEMALDLAPESAAAKHKLHAVRQRFKERETVQTVEQLGLPTTRSKAGVYAMALIGAIFVIAVIAYFLGQHVEERKQELKLGPVVSKNDAPVVDTGSGVLRSPTNAPSPDDDLLKAIQSSGADGARALHAILDPRSHVLTISYSVLEGEDPKALGATIAQSAFDVVPECPVATMRAMRKGMVVYVADALRAKYQETLTSVWKSEHQAAPNAWVDHFLTNEWPVSSSTPAPAAGGTKPTSSGDETGATKDANETAGGEAPAATEGTADAGAPTDAAKDDSTPASDSKGDSGPPGDEPAATGG